MKKLLMGIGIAAMVMGMASMASATEANWLAFLNGFNSSNQANSTFVQFGQQAALGTGYQAPGTPSSANCMLALGWAADPAKGWQNKDLIKAGTGDYTDTIYLTALAGATYADSKIYVKGYTVASMPSLRTWTVKTESGDVLWTGKFTSAASFTVAPVLFSVDASTAGTKLIMTSATAPVTTPEPGSIVAMLSGLAGLVGFGIRRRK